MFLHPLEDPGLHLTVLLPLSSSSAFTHPPPPPPLFSLPRLSILPPDSPIGSFRGGAQSSSWQQSDARAGDSRLSPPDDSDCTDAERVAVEQLAELKKIRLLEKSQSQDLESLMASCATERSFNTIRSCEPVSPIGSSSEFAQRWMSTGTPDLETDRDSRYEDTLDLDFDERARPRSRLLTDLYRREEGESFRVLKRPNRKGETKRRKLHKILKSTGSGGNPE